MSFIALTEPVDRLTVRQVQIAWGSLPSLHGRLLVHRQEQGVLRWMQIQPPYVSCLGTEFWIGADAPTPAPLEADVVTPQNPPDLNSAHIPQTLRYPTTIPLRITLGGRFL